MLYQDSHLEKLHYNLLVVLVKILFLFSCRTVLTRKHGVKSVEVWHNSDSDLDWWSSQCVDRWSNSVVQKWGRDHVEMFVENWSCQHLGVVLHCNPAVKLTLVTYMLNDYGWPELYSNNNFVVISERYATHVQSELIKNRISINRNNLENNEKMYK